MSCQIHAERTVAAAHSLLLLLLLLTSARRGLAELTAADVLYAPPSSCVALPGNCLPGQCQEQRERRAACLATEAQLIHNRTLETVLGGLPTVLDFGAQANTSVDDTAAFSFGLASHLTLRVPPGTYRIDGTIVLPQRTELILDGGASLVRYNVTLNGTVNTDPIVRFYSHSAALSGSGSLVSQVASPRGIVNFGPHNLTYRASNIEYNRLSGVFISGAGCSFNAKGQDTDTSVRGSRGVCFDSGEALGGGGSCYQNAVRDVTVVDVDTGVYFGQEANANSASGVMFYRIGQYSYLFNHNSENTIQGGFTAGFGGNVTIIQCHKCYYNHFSGVQAEPGPGSKYFNFDDQCLWNTVLGHDNTYHGAESYDSGFIYMNSGSLHLGNYNTTTHFNASIEHPADINRSFSLQVQGKGYIKELEHGLHRRAFGQAQGASPMAVEAVDDRPHVLLQQGRQLVIANLTLNVSSAGHDAAHGGVIGAAFYEITISGAGLGSECSPVDNGYAVFAAKYLATPLFVGNRHRLHVKTLSSDLTGQSDQGDGLASDGVLGYNVDHNSATLTVELLECAKGEREIVVDIRRVGRLASQPVARIC